MNTARSRGCPGSAGKWGQFHPNCHPHFRALWCLRSPGSLSHVPRLHGQGATLWAHLGGEKGPLQEGTAGAGSLGSEIKPNHLCTRSGCADQLLGGQRGHKKKQAWDLSVPQRSRGAWQAGRGDPTERPGWLLGGAGTVERLLEGKTGLWVAGRAWWGAARWQGWKPAPSTCVGCRSWAPCNPWPGASLVEPSPSSPPPPPGSASPSAQRARAPGTCLSVEV